MSQLGASFGNFMGRKLSVVAIGGSAGAVELLARALAGLKAEAPFAVLCTLHIPAEGKSLLVDVFQAASSCFVSEPEAGEKIKPGRIYLAPPDYHMSLEADGSLSLSTEEPHHFSRPSIDFLFDSVAEAMGPQALGILVTGANDDGARGLKNLHDRGAATIVEDPRTARFKEMPSSALRLFTPDLELPGDRLKELLSDLSTPAQERSLT